MATLTWRNVDAPNFAPAMEGQRLSARLLSDAFSSIGSGLEQFKQNRTDLADAAVLANANRIQDPEAYKAALASGELMAGINPEHVSAQTQGVLNNRVGALINNASNQYDLSRTQEVNANADNARIGLAAIADAAARGDQAGVLAAREQYAPELAKMAPDQILRIVQTTQGLESGDLRNAGARLDNTQAYRSDSDSQAATAFVNDALRNSANADDARLRLENADLTPGARSAAVSALSKAFPGIYGPVGTGKTGGAPGTGSFATNIPFAETRNYVANITSKAGTITGTNAEKAEKLLPFLIDQESGGNDGAVSPKGARGSTQVMPATGTDPGYGVKPMANQSPEEYRRFGKDYLTAMLDKYDGNVDQALAAYNAGPGNVDQWVADPSINQQTNAALAGLGQQTMAGNVSSGAAQDLVANFGSNATVGSVAKQLGEGDFAGSDNQKLVKKINETIANSAKKEFGGTGTPSINAAQAGAILQRNLQSSNPVGFDGNTGLSSSWWSNETGVSDDGIDAAIRAHNSGASVDQVLSNAALGDISGKITVAQQQFQTKQQALVDIVQRARTQPGIADTIPRYRNDLAMAQQNLTNLLELQRREAPTRQAPVPPVAEQVQPFVSPYPL